MAKIRIPNIKKPANILAELRKIYRDCRNRELTMDEGRTLTLILKTMNGIIESSDLEARLEKLEMQDHTKSRNL